MSESPIARVAAHVAVRVRGCAAGWLLAGLFLAAGVAPADTLDASVQRRLRDTVFEVVLGKPETDPLSYEKDLPLDLLPFTERTSKYRAIGTAFVIDPNKFVTAAHVVAAGTGSQFGPLAMRDAAGSLYFVDKITKYSVEEDYAEFTVLGGPKVKPLETDPHPELNQPVFAVGNALGEGIVIRDGLYTSNTPEERSGRWQWLRFSAAASPGNSGGPLIDKKGRVIGVIVRKSASENLNSAVAIGQVQHGSTDTAVVTSRLTYVFPPMLASEPAVLDEHFPLPKAIADFYATLSAATNQALQRVQTHYLSGHAAQVFPNGSESDSLLYELFVAPFPRAIAQRPDNSWGISEMKTQRAQLDHNGFVDTAALKSYVYVRLRLPDDVAAAAVAGDSKAFMDLLLKALPLRRPVGTDNVRVTSLGRAQEDGSFKDRYARTWQIRTWHVPYNDSLVMSLALPTPQGYVALVKECPTHLQAAQTQELEALAAFTYVSLEGTLGQWRTYQTQAGVPDLVRFLDIRFDDGKNLAFRSARIAFTVPATVQRIDASSRLIVKTTYFRDGESTVWDVGGVYLSDTDQNGNWVDVLRRRRPAPTLPDAFRDRWHVVESGAHPYTGTAYANNGGTRIEAVANAKTLAAGGSTAYTVSISTEGTQDQATMKRKLDAVVAGATVFEK